MSFHSFIHSFQVVHIVHSFIEHVQTTIRPRFNQLIRYGYPMKPANQIPMEQGTRLPYFHFRRLFRLPRFAFVGFQRVFLQFFEPQ